LTPTRPAQVKLRDGVDDKPRQVALRQPLAQARGQQQLLLTITTEEVLRHPGIVLLAADGALCNSLREFREHGLLRCHLDGVGVVLLLGDLTA
jgi:hypothetical protein